MLHHKHNQMGMLNTIRSMYQSGALVKGGCCAGWMDGVEQFKMEFISENAVQAIKSASTNLQSQKH